MLRMRLTSSARQLCSPEDNCDAWQLGCLLANCEGLPAPRARRETNSLRLAKLRGVTFVNQYVVIKYLGKGANGRVFLCLDMCDSRLYAVKVGPALAWLSSCR